MCSHFMTYATYVLLTTIDYDFSLPIVYWIHFVILTYSFHSFLIATQIMRFNKTDDIDERPALLHAITFSRVPQKLECTSGLHATKL